MLNQNNKGKLLCLDLGDKRTGVAISDYDEIISFPRPIIFHDDEAGLFLSLEKLIKDEDIKGIIIGYPKDMSGKKTKQTLKIDKIIVKLEKLFALPIAIVDERLTTVEAKKNIKEKYVDSESARIILENYLSK